MNTFIVKKPHDKRKHTAIKHTYITSYGKAIEVFEIIKPFNLGLYSRVELESITQ